MESANMWLLYALLARATNTLCLRVTILAAVVALGASAGLIAQEPERRTEAPRPAAQLSIPGGSDLVLVPVMLGARDWQFLLDTGSSCSAVDPSLRDLIGAKRDPERVKTAAADIAIDFFTAPRGMRVANLPFSEGSTLAAIDLEAVRRASGYSIYGIVGMDFLGRFAIQLDPDENKLRIYHGGRSFSGKAIPITYDAHTPFITAIFPGQHTQDLLLDTGYYSTGSAGLSSERFELLRRRTSSRAVYQRSHRATASGDANGERAMVVPFLSVGDATVFNLEVGDCGCDVLGLSFFARFKATFDFPNGKLYLEPGRRFQEPDRPDRSGLHIWRVGSNVAVRSVDEGSAAAAAAIESDDIIIEANGTGASDMSLHQLRALLRSKGKSIRLTIRRRGQEQKKTLRL